MSQYKYFRFFLSVVVMVASVGISACGFQPIYAKDYSVNGSKNINVNNKLAATKINFNGSRNAQLLTSEIEDIFYRENILPDDKKKYSLNLSIKINELPIFIEPDGKTLRYRLLITSPYSLVKNTSGKILQNSSLEHIVSYNVSDDDYATFIARENAIKQALKEIAQEYSQRISVYFATAKDNKGK